MTTLARMTPQQRSAHMAKIRGRDTKPEMLVRAFLKSAKVKFETHAEDLPGTPDVVVRDKRVAVFVHGCFWHQHGCRRQRPKTNVAFWTKKFARNIARDRRAERALRAAGWRVLVVWECKARGKTTRARLLKWLAPHRRRCHDCSEIAVEGYAHCRDCRARMAGQPSTRAKRGKASTPARRRRWASLGLCSTCGMPALDGTKTCPKHKLKPRSRSSRNWYRALAAKGLCRCGATASAGHTRCDKCLRKLRCENKKRFRRYKAEGRCQFCPKKRVKGTTWCAKHRARVYEKQPQYTAAFVARRMAAGRCVSCRRKTKGSQHCVWCVGRSRRTRQTRVANKRCGACGGKSTPGYKTCARCRGRNNEAKVACDKRRTA